MKSFLIIAATLCALLHLASAAVDKDKALALFSKCKEQTKAKEDVADILGKDLVPTSSEGKCMLQCVLEARGLMKGDKVDTKAFSDYFEKTFSDDPEKLETAAKAVAICGVLLQGLKGLDKCEVAYKVFQCGLENNLHLV